VKIKNRYIAFSVVVLFAALLFVQSGCVKQHASQLLPNKTPQTFFWLYADSAVAKGISKQELRWWGEDPDGFITGYLVAIVPDLFTIPSPDDTLTYTYVTTTDSTLSFPLREQQRTFLVAIRAIDNTFTYPLQVGAKIKLWTSAAQFPFWDRNDNGMFDSTDVRLDNLEAAIDPVGAKQQFPIINTAPVAGYAYDLTDQTKVIQPPDTTFTVASFTWQATDIDGDETITGYRVTLNDTTANAQWLSFSSTVTMITLMAPRSRTDVKNNGDTTTVDVYSGSYPSLRYIGTLSGLKLNMSNFLLLQAQDVANAYSSSLRLPQKGKTWFVKKPVSSMLVISDCQTDVDAKRLLYRTTFANTSIMSGALANYDELDIRGQATYPAVGPLVPPTSETTVNTPFMLTLKLFDYVFWFTDKYPSTALAQRSLSYYAGSTETGKVIYSTEFLDASDPGNALRDFAPIDSISSVDLSTGRTTFPSLGETTLLTPGVVVQPDSSDMTDLFPVLSYIIPSPAGYIRPAYKKIDARYIYHLAPDVVHTFRVNGMLTTTIRYIGTPNLGVIDGNRRFVFMGVPLSSINGTTNGGQGIVAFFSKVFDEFAK
jgi:hypothetical protein